MVKNGQSSSMSDPKTNSSESAASLDAGAPAKNADAGEAAAPNQLSKEEQWALFEKELKESDWGHQPC
jgi:hypothetical protein